MTVAVTHDDGFLGPTLLPIHGLEPVAESMDGDGEERQPATLHLLSPPVVSSKAQARERRTLDSIVLPYSRPTIPINSLEQTVQSARAGTEPRQSSPEETEWMPEVFSSPVGLVHAFGESTLQEAFSPALQPAPYHQNTAESYQSPSKDGGYQAIPEQASPLTQSPLLHQPLAYQRETLSYRAESISAYSLDNHLDRPTWPEFSRFSFTDNSPRYAIREKGTVEGAVASVDNYRVSHNDVNGSDLETYAKDTKTGKYEKVNRKAGTFYAVMDAVLRQAGLTPEYEVMTYTNTDSGKEEKGLLLTGVREQDGKAQEMLGAPREKMGLLGFVNGKEPGRGTVSLDDYMIRPGDTLSLAYVFQGVYKGDFGKEAGCR